MKLSIRKKLTIYTLVSVAVTLIFAMFGAGVTIYRQTKQQNQSRLVNSGEFIEKNIVSEIPLIKNYYEKFTQDESMQYLAVLREIKKEEFIDMLNTLTSLKTHLFKYGQSSSLDSFGFFSKLGSHNMELKFQYSRKESLIASDTKITDPKTRLGSVKRTQEAAIPFPSFEMFKHDYSIQMFHGEAYLFLKLPFFYLGDEVETLKQGDVIGYFGLLKKIEVDLKNLGRYLGVGINIYDITGKMIKGSYSFNDLSLTPTGFFRDVITLIDQDNVSYDSILRELVYDEKNLGYISVSVPQDVTVLKIQETIMILLLIGCVVFGGVLLVNMIFLRNFSKPIVRLTKITRSIADGNLNLEIESTDRKDEIGDLANSFMHMRNSIRLQIKELSDLNEINSNLLIKLKEYNRNLEHKVEERTKDLNISLQQVKDANEEIMESIRYAEMIQRSMLPALDIFKTNVPDSFVIWMPRNIVGGDIIYADFTKTGIVVALVDCTGHGVPGAFMSMIASSGLRKIVSDEGCNDPAEILKRLNYFVKKTLQQDSKTAESDDGMDVAVCCFNKREQTVTFAGAKQPLFIINDDELKFINGDRQSIGYKKSDLEFNFTNHKIHLKDGMCFYLTTDGFVDQLGGEKRVRRMFGKKRFKQLLLENHHKPYDNQRNELMNAFYAHKGDNDRQDDVTLLGWSLTKYKQTVVLVATIVFSDSVSNSKSQILDTYLKNITPDVKNNHGYINNDTSNSIIIFFSNKADTAIDISIMMQKRLRELSLNNEDIANGIINISIGIYTCTLAVRSFEELETIDKENITSEVQLTTLLSILNNRLGTSTLICDTSFSKLKKIADYNHRFIGRVRLQEKREDLAVFEIFDSDYKDVIIKKQECLEEYDRGIFYYNTKHFSMAIASFKLVLELNPQDLVAAMYLERSEYFLKNESPPDWEYIELLDV